MSDPTRDPAAGGTVAVGVLGKVRGLAGEIRLRSVTDFPDRYLRPGPFLLKRGDEFVPVRLLSARHFKDETWIARLEGFGVEQAERAVGCELHVPAAKRVKPPRGTFYIEELTGFAVVDPAGAPLGEVTGAEWFPAGDCLIVRRSDGRETLVLFARSTLTVERAARRVVLLDPTALDPVDPAADDAVDPAASGPGPERAPRGGKPARR